ncbi:monocarboxylate transporter 3 isoform X2 [Patella vulgata]|uniref:monocarboxylate transporter 3 isoform X2 n=1 Tax=Patella vulgata TaxID=6465 RepID=UPI002180283F|nr:monocarboxylate transporter 3 isoform X2 [Patella vulgata]
MNIFLNGSLPYSVGVIHIALLDRYPDEDIITISWLGSVFSCMFMLSAFIGSIIINVFNVRTCVMLSGLVSLVGFGISSIVTDFRLLFLTFGLIAGCGQAMAYTGSMVAVGFYFKHKTGMAAGIISCGSPISLFVFPVLAQFLIDKYTLQGTFLLLGAIGFHAAVCGALMRPTKYEIGPTQYCRRHKRPAIKSNVGQEEEEKIALKTKMMANLSLFRCLPFVLLLISSLTSGAALSTIYLFLPDYINTLNSSSQDTIVLLFIGIGGTFSRLFLGFLTVAADAAVLYGTTFGIFGVITLFLNHMTSLLSQIIYAALFGLYTGGCFTLQHVIMVDIVGVNKLSTAYGINALMVGIGYLTGPPAIRLLVDSLDDQYYIFICAGKKSTTLRTYP